jgi:hypothetical protein
VRYIAVLVLLMAGMTSAEAQSPGDWVLARGARTPHWLPGVVERAWGNNITVRYDDGEMETMHFTAVRRNNWTVGTIVECSVRTTGWHPARIAALAGERLWLVYEDGERDTTTRGRCRSH